MSNGLKAKIRAAADRVAALQAEVNKLVNVASEIPQGRQWNG